MTFTYRRSGVERSVRIPIASDKVGDKVVGRIRVAPSKGALYPENMMLQIRLSPAAALARAGTEAWNMTALQGRLFWRMVLGQFSVKNLNGPLSIAEYAGDSAEAGVASFLSFPGADFPVAGISQPAAHPDSRRWADRLSAGGVLKGSPLSERAQAFGQQVGIALLILLMGVALFNDIARQLS